MSVDQINATFTALADPTRRAILARLAQGEASAGELAAPFSMSQPAITKHLKMLEKANLVTVSIDGKRRPRRMNPQPLKDAQVLIRQYQDIWDANYARLDAVLDDLQKSTKGESTS